MLSVWFQRQRRSPGSKAFSHLCFVPSLCAPTRLQETFYRYKYFIVLWVWQVCYEGSDANEIIREEMYDQWHHLNTWSFHLAWTLPLILPFFNGLSALALLGHVCAFASLNLQGLTILCLPHVMSHVTDMGWALRHNQHAWCTTS